MVSLHSQLKVKEAGAMHAMVVCVLCMLSCLSARAVWSLCKFLAQTSRRAPRRAPRHVPRRIDQSWAAYGSLSK